MKAVLVALASLHLWSCFVSGKLEKCHFGDGDCIKDTINKLLLEYPNGHPSINLKPFDPFSVENFNVKPNPGSGLVLEGSWTNATIHGLKDMKAYDVKGFGKDLEGPHEISFKSQEVGVTGHYKANGKIAMLSLEAQGQGSVNLTDLDWSVSFTGEPEVRNGKTYLKVVNFKVTEKSIGKCVMYFGNLLGSMTKMLNDFIVQNWKEFYYELNHSINKNFEEIMFKYVQDVFFSTPYEELFKKDK